MAISGHTDGAVDIVFGDVQVTAGFRFADASELAGAPIELEFFAQLNGRGPRYLLVPSGRVQDRPGDFSFAATFAGTLLTDPYAHVPDMGGPATIVEVVPGRPWIQPLILNQFVSLESLLDHLEPGASGYLSVACRRMFALAVDEHSALMSVFDPPRVEVSLGLELRRDDARLATLVDQLVDQVLRGPKEQRERPLSLLLSLRAPLAVARWRHLVGHPDPAVAERVQHNLARRDGIV